MKNTLYYVLLGAIMALGLTLSCQNEDGIDRENYSEKIINHFFNDKDVESPWTKNAMSIIEKSISVKTRSDTTDVIKNFIDKFGQPIWKEAMELGNDENDFAILVPVVNKSCDEIETILYFIIEEGKYKFYPVQRNLIDKDDIEKLLPFDYFTYNTLKKKPRSGIIFKEMEETPKTRAWHEGVECRQIESYAGPDDAEYMGNPENWNSRWVCKNVYKYIPDNSWGNTHNEKKDYIERDEFGGGGGGGPAHGGGAKEPSNPNDEIIKDESFKDSRADCIFERLVKNNNGFSNMIKKFDGEFPVCHLKLEIGNLEDNVNGRTHFDDNFTNRIEINSKTLGTRPSIMVARTIAHEAIHANIFRMIRMCLEKGTPGWPNMTNEELKDFKQKMEDNFPGVFDYYSRYGFKKFQHEQMAQHYLEIIASYIHSFDNSYPLDVCKKIAWVGLKGTTAWDKLSESEKGDINSTIKAVETTKEENDPCDK